ncbi:zf-HC2 domain-containing protein [Rhodobacteraceae bacterium KMM 6894]|nr:zf-HC2 domain-containing protein [Rhodobacteraceae bacterium KMM 6894]
MLNCKEVANRASALIDGDLSTWEAIQMRLHLAMCGGCKRFIGQMRITRSLTEIPTSDDPQGGVDDSIDAILGQLHEEKQKGG